MRQFRAMSRLILFFFFVTFTAGAAAQFRTIPQEAQRGEIRHLQDMLVEIDGQRRLLAPGAQIRDADNRLILPVSLSEKSEVKYVLDASGLVHRVWILSAKEK
jgi:hypothetical protein